MHPATDGIGILACSGDMLLEALVACSGVKLRAVATSLAIEITDRIIYAEGDLEFQGYTWRFKRNPGEVYGHPAFFRTEYKCDGGADPG